MLLFILGAAGFTLAEYAVHRWLLHGLSLSYLDHRHHHAMPDDYAIGWSVPAIAVSIATLTAVLWSITFGAGVLLAWGWYAYVHWRVHHRPFPRASLLFFLQRHHENHHRLARRNFGVSTTWWDVILRTRT